jgi:hypothetical protein
MMTEKEAEQKSYAEVIRGHQEGRMQAFKGEHSGNGENSRRRLQKKCTI